MIFFDFLYFNMYRWYSQIKNGNPEGGSSCFLIAGLQLFNILSGILIYDVINNSPIKISKLIILLIYFGLICFNYFRYIYFDNLQLRIKNEWEIKTIDDRRLWLNILILYVVASFLVFFGLIIFLASKL